ncbi:MAG: hypothetical protein JWQ25_1167 [Daejeonella sp.]|nr:hypothetical protein [Daejeonella sp.]
MNVQHDVKLNRVIGKLDINIEDAIPANANKIDFRFDNAPTQFLLGSGVTSGGSWYGDRGDTLETNDYDDYTMWHAIQIKSSEKGMNNFLSSRVVFGSDRGFLVEIRCFDINNKIIARKYVQNVHVYANKRTLLTGKLFDNRQQAGFSVTVNSDWNPESEVVNF